jgi:hypothetical protein
VERCPTAFRILATGRVELNTIPMTVLITTANKPPDRLPFLKMTDPVMRVVAAKAALYFWVAQGIQQIVLADATGNNLLTEHEWEEIDKSETSIEQINYKQASDSVIKHGKGYGEGKLIEYAVNNSALLARVEYFFKCTGKTYVRNFSDIAGAIKTRNAQGLFWKHIGDDGTAMKPWADCRFYYTSKTFAKEHLIPAYLASDDNVAFCENQIYEMLNRNMEVSRCLRPFIMGYSGATGEPYFDSSLGMLDNNFPCWITKR